MIRFGTDGLRGVAGVELTAEIALSLGFHAARALAKCANNASSLSFLVGKDPRLSSDMLEAALSAGITMSGASVLRCGVVPTPAVPWLLAGNGIAGGFMITASHNPIQDNGIKIFGPDGRKLPESAEREIEKGIASGLRDSSTAPYFGRSIEAKNLADKYTRFVRSALPNAKRAASAGIFGRPLKFVFDCAYGATGKVCKSVFGGFPGDHVFLNAEFDGTRINQNCGSMNLGPLSKAVRKHSADIGFAFDGDGDRVLVVDSSGKEINGDRLIGALAVHERKYRNSGAVVVTVMSNLGLEEFLANHNIEMHRVPVGDKNVMDQLVERGLLLGGEQSGHLILLDKSCSGDGLLAAASIVKLVYSTGKTISELTSDIPVYPQYLENLRVLTKDGWDADKKVSASLSALSADYSGKVRLLVRPSGTEPLIRVMTESKSAALAKKVLKAACAAIMEWDAQNRARACAPRAISAGGSK
ncbi:MAG: phosphoglucosamine mutase [bacterium]